MSATALPCPNCQVRLKVAAPAQGDKSFSCPKCGHVILVPGQAVPGSSGHKGLLLALIGLVFLVGAGIITAIFMGRTPPTPKHNPNVAQVAPAKDNLEAMTREQEKKRQDETAKDKEDKVKGDKEKRSQEYLRWMIEGGTAANSQQWPEALAAYEEALKVMPGDAAAGQKLREVKTSLESLARSKLSDDKLQADLKTLLEQGNEALRKKQYAAALEVFKLVLQKSPGDSEAGNGLVAAQIALAQDQSEHKKQEDFQKHLVAGQAALKSGRYGDAVAEFIAAQLILPKNAQAARLQRDAEKMLTAEKNRKDQKADYDRLIDLATASLRNLRYDEAIAAYTKALQIIPNDPSTTRGLADARQALQNATLELATLLARGANAMRDFRFKDAIDAYREATRLSPGNENAATALRVAEIAFENRASYVAAMRRGNLALNNLIFDEAAAAYADALRIVPNDPLATLGLQEAQKGLADYVRRRRDSDLLIQAGTAAAKQRKYAETAKAFKDALKTLPTHPQADTIRILYRYNDNMADGTTALAARRYQDAIRHFQAALLEVPNDVSANQALTRARALNNKS